MSVPWTWEVDLKKMIGLYATIETTDGSRREGKITDVVVQAVPINFKGSDTKTYDVPLHVTLNGDPTDLIEFIRIHTLKLR
jgi:hypothetical protein